MSTPPIQHIDNTPALGEPYTSVEPCQGDIVALRYMQSRLRKAIAPAENTAAALPHTTYVSEPDRRQHRIVLLRQARAVIIATPIYKASYSGVLKTFLDLLPQQALMGKLVLPIATGGAAVHMLAIDYALRPVLTALGAQHTLQGVYNHRLADSARRWGV